MNKLTRAALITTIFTLLMVMCSCQTTHSPWESICGDAFTANYQGNYEVIVNAEESDEHSYIWSLDMHFLGDQYNLLVYDSTGNECETRGTFVLDRAGLLGRVELIDTAPCSSWFEGADFSAPGPRGEFDVTFSAVGILMFRQADNT